jgi:hypothetical protein
MVEPYVCGAIVANAVFGMEFVFSYRFQSDHLLRQVLITGMQWHRPKKKCQNCHAMTAWECHQRVALGNSLTV